MKSASPSRSSSPATSRRTLRLVSMWIAALRARGAPATVRPTTRALPAFRARPRHSAGDPARADGWRDLRRLPRQQQRTPGVPRTSGHSACPWLADNAIDRARVDGLGCNHGARAPGGCGGRAHVLGGAVGDAVPRRDRRQCDPRPRHGTPQLPLRARPTGRAPTTGVPAVACPARRGARDRRRCATSARSRPTRRSSASCSTRSVRVEPKQAWTNGGRLHRGRHRRGELRPRVTLGWRTPATSTSASTHLVHAYETLRRFLSAPHRLSPPPRRHRIRRRSRARCAPYRPYTSAPGRCCARRCSPTLFHARASSSVAQ